MSDYLNREKLLKDISETFCYGCNNYNDVLCRACTIDDLSLVIDDFPAEEVSE